MASTKKNFERKESEKERSQKIISAKNLFNVSGKMGFLQKHLLSI
jgi:hypothetical protein